MMNSKNFRKKQLVSLPEVLGYFEAMNNSNPFKNQQLCVNVKKQTYLRNQSKPTQKKMQQIDPQTEGKKKLNKNRAIKRVMESSLDLLLKNFHPQQQKPDVSSTTTQFQIYLKQYNRLLERINKQQRNKSQKLQSITQKKEQVLQNVYNYIVTEDFRGMVGFASLSTKISKDNINILLEKDIFSLSLISLKMNQLKIINPNNDSSRSVRLFEIQNIDYHTQPVIITVFTIVKDRSKVSEFIYLKFQTLGEQDKWDRAFYCNYMGRKIKKKTKLFQAIYPVEQQETQQSVQIQHGKNIKQFQLSTKNVISKLINEKQEQEQQQPIPQDQANQDQKNKGIRNLLTEQFLSYRTPRQESPTKKMAVSKLKSMDVNLNKFSPSEQVKDAQQNNIFSNLLNNNSKRKKSKQYIGLPLIDDLLKQQQKIDFVESQNIGSVVEKTSQQILSDRKKQIESKYNAGVQLKKSKFFFDKYKILEFKSGVLCYSDVNTKTKEKSDSKNIEIKAISQTMLKGNKLEIAHGNKKIQFIGEQQHLRQIRQWINLQMTQIKKRQNLAN